MMTAMQSEQTLRRSGKWTGWTTRQCRILRKEIVTELGGTEPKGRKRFYLESFIQKYGVFYCMIRELRDREIFTDTGDLIGMLDKNFLAWQHSLSRDLGLLFGDAPTKDDFERLMKP
ncbi:MAG: hypothetical protein HZB10_00395 [Candidatus Yonathbacteria bacterium]|nr:hypothetical protein [Candidatus Yonathbacteria bacterium]